jgi:phosphoglycolate phosphatase
VTIAAVIFDLDGTLADSLRDIAEHMNDTLAEHGLARIPVADYAPFVGNGVRELVRRAAPAEDADALVEAFRARYRAAPVVHTRPYPGIVELLDSLDARLAVLSNKPHALTEAVVNELFPGRFAAVLGEREGTPRKPDPAGALALARALEVPPEACALVGDSDVDVETALRAGMRAIAVSWGLRPRAALAAAHAIIDAPAQLTRWLG